jgi:hypothetical protein
MGGMKQSVRLRAVGSLTEKWQFLKDRIYRIRYYLWILLDTNFKTILEIADCKKASDLLK